MPHCFFAIVYGESRAKMFPVSFGLLSTSRGSLFCHKSDPPIPLFKGLNNTVLYLNRLIFWVVLVNLLGQ
jgi:hypothetical protein